MFYRVFVICISFILDSMILLLAGVSLNNISASAQTYSMINTNEQSDILLDSDIVEGEGNYTIRDYVSHMHATDASVQVNNDNEYALFGMLVDDPIVKKDKGCQ